MTSGFVRGSETAIANLKKELANETSPGVRALILEQLRFERETLKLFRSLVEASPC